MYGCFVCKYVCILYACPVHAESEEGVLTPGTGVVDGSELLYVSWELNSGLL